MAVLTNLTPVDKVNFIRAYAKAREARMTKKIIRSRWRVTRNWPISRAKALRHPEIQADKVEVVVKPVPYLGSDDTPKCSRHIRDLGKNKTPVTRRRYAVIAKGFEVQEQALAADAIRIASLEEEVARLKRGKKRKAVPNPNRRFMTLSEALAAGEAIPGIKEKEKEVILVEEEEEEAEGAEITVMLVSPPRITRFGRVVKKRRLS